ncbi:unnamed protein product [Closterium sp. Yama58-4]|nr:unnamed protein product [Closterium sp. Yama58-4]
MGGGNRIGGGYVAPPIIPPGLTVRQQTAKWMWWLGLADGRDYYTTAELFTLSSAQGLIHLQHSPQADLIRAQASARGSSPRMHDVLVAPESFPRGEAPPGIGGNRGSAGKEGGEERVFEEERGLCDAPRILPVTEHRIGRQLIVDEDVGMVYCYVQKAGCTSWKFWLREQHHHPFPKSFLSAHTAHFTNVTAVWYSLTEPQAIRALTRRDFTRFVFLRNPYTRVLSAYLDKMLRGGGPDDLGAGFWAQAFFGQLITHSLWDAMTFQSGPGTARLRSIWEIIQLRTGFRITFDEFVGYLGEAWEIESRFHLDVHIVPQTLLCVLDRIKYDFVGRFESMDEDVMTLMRRFGREPGDAFSFGKKLQKTKSRGRLSEAFANKKTFDTVSHVYSLDVNNTLNHIVFLVRGAAMDGDPNLDSKVPDYELLESNKAGGLTCVRLHAATLRPLRSLHALGFRISCPGVHRRAACLHRPCIAESLLPASAVLVLPQPLLVLSLPFLVQRISGLPPSLVAYSGSVPVCPFQSFMETGGAGKVKGLSVAAGGDGDDGGYVLGSEHALSSTLLEVADPPAHGMEHNHHNGYSHRSIFEEPGSILGDTTTNTNGHAGNINGCADITNGHAGNIKGGADNTNKHADSALLVRASVKGSKTDAIGLLIQPAIGLPPGCLEPSQAGLAVVGGDIEGNLHGRESSCSCDEPVGQRQVKGGAAASGGGENGDGGYGMDIAETLGGGRGEVGGGGGRSGGGGGGETERDGATSVGGREADSQRVLAQPPLHILQSVRPEPLNGYNEQGQEGPAGSMAPVIHGMLLAHPTAEKPQELEWDDLIGRIEAEIEKPQASSCVDGESSSIARQDSQIVTSGEGAVPPSDAGATKREAGKGKARRVVQRKRPANSTSKFRGVTHHCRTGRWEAHIWEEGRQVYLGGFDSEKQAALMYDIAALKMRGEDAQTNLPPEEYTKYTKEIEAVPKEELILLLRRHSKGFARGTSKYRGVTKHQKVGRGGDLLSTALDRNVG